SYLIAPDKPADVAQQPIQGFNSFSNGDNGRFVSTVVKPLSTPSSNLTTASIPQSAAPMAATASPVQFAPVFVSPSMQCAVPAPAVAGAAPVPTSGAVNYYSVIIRPKPGDAADDEQEEEEE